jgi:hypothetical protein
MNRHVRIYYYAVFGAIGGLLGWQISNWIGLSTSSNIYLSDALVGAVIGLSFGLPIGSGEGFIARNPLRMIRGAGIGSLMGLAAGAVALPLAEIIFNALGAGALGRAVGWSIFGAVIGLVEGVTGGSQMWKGAAGGAAGGFVGGLLIEILIPLGGSLASGKAISLVLLGISIGTMIALMVVLLSKAWLEVMSGKLKGTVFILDKFMSSSGPNAIIGSSSLKAEIVLPDPDVAPQHAMMIGSDTHFSIKDISLQGTYLEGQKVNQASLVNGNRFQLGKTMLVYHERR